MSVELEKLHHMLVQMRLEDVTGDNRTDIRASSIQCFAGEDNKYLIAGGDANAAKLLQQLSAFKVCRSKSDHQLACYYLQTSGPQEADKEKARKEGEKCSQWYYSAF